MRSLWLSERAEHRPLLGLTALHACTPGSPTTGLSSMPCSWDPRVWELLEPRLQTHSQSCRGRASSLLSSPASRQPQSILQNVPNLTGVIPSQTFSLCTIISVSAKQLKALNRTQLLIACHLSFCSPDPLLQDTVPLNHPTFSLLLVYLAVFLDMKSLYVLRNCKAE